jgi:tetratricopeptide (TPR) repeat protein
MITGHYDEALRVGEHALGILEELLGEDHRGAADISTNLAEVHARTMNYLRAEAMLKKALGVYEKTLQEGHPTTIASVINLADLYRSRGAHIEAESLYKKALARLTNKTDTAAAELLDSMAELHLAIGALDKALSEVNQSLEIKSALLPRLHPSTTRSLNILARLYREMGDYQLAERYFLTALKDTQKVWGETHPNSLTMINNIGAFYFDSGVHDKAAVYLD